MPSEIVTPCSERRDVIGGTKYHPFPLVGPVSAEAKWPASRYGLSSGYPGQRISWADRDERRDERTISIYPPRLPHAHCSRTNCHAPRHLTMDC